MLGDKGKQDAPDRKRFVVSFGTVVFILLIVGAAFGFLQFIHVWGNPTDKDPRTIEDPQNKEKPEN